MKKKNILFLIIIAVIIFSALTYNTIILRGINQKKAEELVKNISFEVYSNENNKTEVLVLAEDTENGISSLTYPDGKVINANGKNKIAVDYEINQNGEYKFSFQNNIGENIEKTLVFNDEYSNSLITINVTSQKTLDTEADVEIIYSDYNEISKDDYYKVGEKATEWENYNEIFKINSYDILNGNLANDDNTVTIYAKQQDVAKNKVIITKKVTQLDLDMPEKPEIVLSAIDTYPTLTTDGVKFNSNAQINFDTRDDITNYYSTDKGNSWNKYTESFNTDVTEIYAKSVKNESELEIITNKNVNSVLGQGSLICEAYDGNSSTYEPIHAGSILNVDSEMIGKKFTVDWYSPYSDRHYHVLYMYFKDLEYNTLQTNNCSIVPRDGCRETRTFTIPENTDKIVWSGAGDSCTRVYEINSVKDE